MRVKKRIGSILLAVCLALNCLPVTARAAELDSRVEKAIKWAINIANDNSHGYSQSNRNGPDYDCSSFVSTAFNQGGFNVSPSCWTGNMEAAFKAVGFKSYPASSVTIQRGDILLAHNSSTQHVELYLGNNQCVAAHWDDDGRTGDSGGHEIEVRSKAYCTFCNYKQYTTVLRFGADSLPSNVQAKLNKSSYILGDTVTITPSATGATQYSLSIWDGGAFRKGTEVFHKSNFTGSVSYTPQKTGVYNIRLDAINGAGYTSIDKTFTVNASIIYFDCNVQINTTKGKA